MEDDELTQLTLLDSEYEQKAAEVWEREQRQTKVGRPRKGEEKRKPGREADQKGDREGLGDGSGARMSGATRGGSAQRGGSGRPRHPNQEARLGGTLFDVDAVAGRRVARQTVVGALKRALGRIRDPSRWTPLHLAASRREDQSDLCWWSRWPPPQSQLAIKWSAEGAVIATTPDEQVARLATAALGRGISTVEQEEGHAATVEYLERRIEAVQGIAAEYVTRRDILEAVAGLPVAAGESEAEDDRRTQRANAATGADRGA